MDYARTDGCNFGEDRCANILAISDARLTAFDRSEFLEAIHASSEAVDWLLGQLGRVDEFSTNDVFGIPRLNQT